MQHLSAQIWAGFTALCAPGGALSHPGLPVLGLLGLAGAAGSLTHCGAMCGPFVLAQTADRMARLPIAALTPRARALAGLALPYHAGRITSYALLGGIAGGLGLGVRGIAGLAALRPALLLLAAVIFLGFAVRGHLPGLGQAIIGRLPHAPARWGGLISRLNTALRAAAPRSPWAAQAGLGLALGFLPCGLVYAVLIAAAAAGSPAWGAAAMAAFGLGTVPLLAAIGLGTSLAAGRPGPQAVLTRAAPAILGANALVLALLAFS